MVKVNVGLGLGRAIFLLHKVLLQQTKQSLRADQTRYRSQHPSVSDSSCDQKGDQSKNQRRLGRKRLELPASWLRQRLLITRSDHPSVAYLLTRSSSSVRVASRLNITHRASSISRFIPTARLALSLLTPTTITYLTISDTVPSLSVSAAVAHGLP